ncbi:MAG: hypothetical protein HOP32_07005 [Nitrospira sp.]|nr:hypothetical protein [Nitrospira sp.]
MPGQAKRQRLYHTLSNEALETLWEKHGDLEAKTVLEARRIVRDLATNPHTEIAEPQIRLASRFWLQFKKNRSGRVGMWLELDESLSIDKIKQHWPEIRQWQDFLDDWQLPRKSGGYRYVLSLHQSHRRGVSYSALAESVAEDAISWLEWYQSQKLTDFKKALPTIDSWSDQEVNHWASECSAALQLFKLVGVKDEESIRAWWIGALKHFSSKNKKLIKAETPVTRENIIETLRAFRKRFKLKDGVGKIG